VETILTDEVCACTVHTSNAADTASPVLERMDRINGNLSFSIDKIRAYFSEKRLPGV
jgi:hypothetical protein